MDGNVVTNPLHNQKIENLKLYYVIAFFFRVHCMCGEDKL